MVSGASWHADVARGTSAWMRHGGEATWQGRGWPTRGAGGAQGADTWQEATRVHGSTRTPVWGATWQERVGRWRTHGLVGPGKYIRAVTQMRTAPLVFIVDNFYFLFRVGLCPHKNLPLQDGWLHQSRRRRSQAVDRLDRSPRDHQSIHVLKNHD